MSSSRMRTEAVARGASLCVTIAYGDLAGSW